MGIDTKRTCDKCGDSWVNSEDDKQLTRLELNFTPYKEIRSNSYDLTSKILYLCKTCFLDTGLKYQCKNKDHPEPINLTAEEAISVFLENLGFNREG